MHQEHKALKLILFLLRVLDNSKKYGGGEQFIQGQLDEAYHQLSLHKNKITRG